MIHEWFNTIKENPALFFLAFLVDIIYVSLNILIYKFIFDSYYITLIAIFLAWFIAEAPSFYTLYKLNKIKINISEFITKFFITSLIFYLLILGTYSLITKISFNIIIRSFLFLIYLALTYLFIIFISTLSIKKFIKEAFKKAYLFVPIYITFLFIFVVFVEISKNFPKYTFLIWFIALFLFTLYKSFLIFYSSEII